MDNPQTSTPSKTTVISQHRAKSVKLHLNHARDSLQLLWLQKPLIPITGTSVSFTFEVHSYFNVCVCVFACVSVIRIGRIASQRIGAYTPLNDDWDKFELHVDRNALYKATSPSLPACTWPLSARPVAPNQRRKKDRMREQD